MHVCSVGKSDCSMFDDKGVICALVEDVSVSVYSMSKPSKSTTGWCIC